MTTHHFLKVIETLGVGIFALLLVCLAVTGTLSTLGIDHSWAYPHR